MRPLAIDEIVDLERYAAIRDAYRERVIAHKKARRFGVGDRVTLLFEDRETLRFQVQEMLHVERIADPEKVQIELDVYNELMPGPRELSATLFIEIPDLAQIRPALDRLVGLDEHVFLVFGDGEAEEAARARFDPGQLEEERISAVHYLRFPLSDAQAAALADPGTPARLRIDHSHYTAETALSPEGRRTLAADLAGDPPSLLPHPGPAPGSRADEPLFATARVRALRPGRPIAPGHVVVEPIEPVPSLLEADAALLAELLDAVKRAARDVVADHGACRVVTQVGGGSERLRWHVYAPLEPGA